MYKILILLFSFGAFAQTQIPLIQYQDKDILWNNYRNEYCSGDVEDYDKRACFEDISNSEEKYQSYEKNVWAWRDNSVTLKMNNCYNYATGIKTNTFAQPGKKSGREWDIFSCKDVGEKLGVVNAAINDGLVKVANPQSCLAHERAVYLVVSPDRDYHWLVREENGLWMHKNGWLAPTMLDSTGRLITNPETAIIMTDSRGWYKDKCGFFCVDPDKVSIK